MLACLCYCRNIMQSVILWISHNNAMNTFIPKVRCIDVTSFPVGTHPNWDTSQNPYNLQRKGSLNIPQLISDVKLPRIGISRQILQAKSNYESHLVHSFTESQNIIWSWLQIIIICSVLYFSITAVQPSGVRCFWIGGLEKYCERSVHKIFRLHPQAFKPHPFCAIMAVIKVNTYS